MLISAGGGAVGERLLRAALAARPPTRYAERPGCWSAGHNLPASVFAVSRRRLPAGCALERHRPDLAALMGRCEVSVSQAGYNTVVEGLAAGARMVLVPFAAGEEDEQEAAGRAAGRRWAWPSGSTRPSVDGPSLAAAIDRIAAAAATRPGGDWSFDGAARSADDRRRTWSRERFGDG